MIKVTFVDTSVLCEMLQVPGKCSPERGAEVTVEADLRAEAGEHLVIPVTTVIETGNHIAQADEDRHNAACRFVAFLRAAVAEGGPWRLLETRLGAEFLSAVCDGDSTGQSFESLAAEKVGAGDIAILVERDQFLSASALRDTDVWTFDQRLAALATQAARP